MKLDHIPLDLLYVDKTNMRFGRKAPDVSDILPTIRARGVIASASERHRAAGRPGPHRRPRPRPHQRRATDSSVFGACAWRVDRSRRRAFGVGVLARSDLPGDWK